MAAVRGFDAREERYNGEHASCLLQSGNNRAGNTASASPRSFPGEEKIGIDFVGGGAELLH
jgi:hypothetical protein